MKKLLKQSIIFIFVFILVLIPGFAFVHKGDMRIYEKPNFPAIDTLELDNAFEYNNCKLENGNIMPTGPDPYIEFNQIPQNAKSFVINFSKNVSDTTSANIQWKINDYYRVLPCSNIINNIDDYYLYSTALIDVSSIKVIINDSKFIINDIQVFDKELPTTILRQNTSLLHLILIITFSLIISFLFLVLNNKFRFIDKIANFIRMLNYKKIFKNILVIIFILIISLIVELIITTLSSEPESQISWFNLSRIFVLSGILISGYLVFLVIKKNNLAEETIFIVLSLAIGSSMILACPYENKSYDLDSHFGWIKGMSNINAEASEAENSVISVFTGTSTDIEKDLKTSLEFKNNFDQADKVTNSKTTRQIQICHIPGSIIYSTSKFFNIPIYIRLLLIRFTYLILYSIICFFAIRKIKSHKMLLVTIALFPTCIFLASNITYDWWVTSFTMLGMSYFLSEAQQPNKKLTIKNICIMCTAFIVGCLPKLIYITLMIIPFFLFKNEFKNNIKSRMKYYLILVSFLAFAVILLSFVASSQINSQGDIRGGTQVNAKEQFMYILNNPFAYIQTLTNFMLNYLNVLKCGEYITCFAYFGTEYCKSLLMLILLIVAAIFGNNNYSNHTAKWYYKIISILIFIGTVSLIATSLYISYSPVASNGIAGCQPRYLIPLIFPLTSLLFSLKFKLKINRKILNASSVFIISFVSYWSIWTYILPNSLPI